MTFEEIFKEEGLYVADTFCEGVCYEVDETNVLKLVIYGNRNDIKPIKTNAIVSGDSFKKDYKKVYTRQSLFK